MFFHFAKKPSAELLSSLGRKDSIQSSASRPTLLHASILRPEDFILRTGDFFLRTQKLFLRTEDFFLWPQNNFRALEAKNWPPRSTK